MLIFYGLVLSNPKQREIYNQFGAEGIEAAWQLGPHLDQTEKVEQKCNCFSFF